MEQKLLREEKTGKQDIFPSNIKKVPQKSLKLGPFENLHLLIIGKRDGKINLPREDESMIWMSPFIKKEIDLYNKNAAHIWQETENMLFQRHVDLKNIIFRSEQYNSALTELLMDNSGDVATKEKIIRVKAALENAQSRASALKAQIDECEAIAKLKCFEMLSQCLLRIDTYWHGCVKTNTSIPPVMADSLLVKFDTDAEKLYLSQHIAEKSTID